MAEGLALEMKEWRSGRWGEKPAGASEAGAVVEKMGEAAGDGIGVGVTEWACPVEAGHVAESAGANETSDDNTHTRTHTHTHKDTHRLSAGT